MSWRRMRSSSPETSVPRSSGRLDSLPRRSRSSCRASPAKELQESRQILALLGSGDDGVEMAEAKVVLGEPEAFGQLLAGRLLDDARTGKRDQRAGLGDRHVAER